MSARASNLNSIKKRFLQLHPTNATSGNIYSFKSGLPLIKFDIASSDVPLFLDGAALRLTGNLTAKQGADANTNLTATELNFLDGFAGINNMIEMVTISSKGTNNVLERITNYYRLVPSIVSGTNSEKDIETRMSIAGNQHGTIPLTKSTLASYNGIGSLGGVAAASQVGAGFSTPLYCGLLQSGQDLDLSMSKGLVIEILLRADVGTIFGANASANNASYKISNLVLTAPVYEMGGMAAAEYQAGVNQFNFNSWSSMFQTINSSTSVVAMTPGLSRVASVLTNFITASDLGDQRYNACRLGDIGEINQLRFSKNGASFPLQYRLQTVSNQNNNSTAVVGAANRSFHVYSVNADVVRNYLESLTTDRYSKVRNCMAAYNTWAGGAVDRAQNAGRTGITPGTVGGNGILFDAYGSGTDFSQQVFSFELKCSGTNLLRINATPTDVSNSIDGTAATAQAAVLFFLNKNTLMSSPTGMNVQR